MRVGNINFLPQGYGVLRNRGHDIFDVSALVSGNKSEPHGSKPNIDEFYIRMSRIMCLIKLCIIC